MTAYEIRISDWSSDVCSSDLMAKRKSNRPNKAVRNENPTGRFARLPHEVMLSAAYRSLTPNARALLVEMMAMENGQNNGSLWLSIRDAAARIGLVNKESVGKAFDEDRKSTRLNSSH